MNTDAIPDQSTEDYRRWAVLFNDISNAPTAEHVKIGDRHALTAHLWEQGWRRDVRPEDVTETRQADAWDEGYRRGALDECGDLDAADNPYRPADLPLAPQPGHEVNCPPDFPCKACETVSASDFAVMRRSLERLVAEWREEAAMANRAGLRAYLDPRQAAQMLERRLRGPMVPKVDR